MNEKGQKIIDDHLWNGCSSLKDYVIKMYKEKKTDEPEFQTVLKVFGVDKCRQIVRDYLDSLKEGKANESKSTD